MDTTVTCPACNKADQPEAACTRCGCDLTRLHRIVEAAWSRLDAAHRALRAGDYRAALHEASLSWRLCHLPESAGLAFVAAAVLGQTELAVGWHRRSVEG